MTIQSAWLMFLTRALIASVVFLWSGAGLMADEPHPFTIATYNILYRNRDLPKLVTTLRETAADVVALQETNPESEKFLREKLAREYPHMAFRAGQHGSDGLGSALQILLAQLDVP